MINGHHTYFPMYSPCKRVLQVTHLKHQTCHCESSAIRAWPSTISLEQPVHSRKRKFGHPAEPFIINRIFSRPAFFLFFNKLTRGWWWRVGATIRSWRTGRRAGSGGFHWRRWCGRHDGNLDTFRTQHFFACKGHSFPGRERLPV